MCTWGYSLCYMHSLYVARKQAAAAAAKEKRMVAYKSNPSPDLALTLNLP